jgi:monoterpene epsilon-lactone hydrolase
MFGVPVFLMKAILRTIKARARYKSIPVSRQRFERIMSRFKSRFNGLTYEPFLIQNMKCEWIIPDGAEDKKALLYFHGGGYGAGSIETHRAQVSNIVKYSGIKTLVINYRLAPENKYPAPIEDAVSAYQGLLKEGYEAKQIAFGGDSAGGGIAIGSALYLRDNQIPLPACIVAMSPWLDLSMSGPTIRSKNGIDPILVQEGFAIWSAAYLGDADPKAPYASPVFGDLTGLPPTYIQVGEDEMLLSDSTRFAEKAKADGVDIQIEIYPGMFHVFNAYWRILPIAKKANKKLGEFLRRQLSK